MISQNCIIRNDPLAVIYNEGQWRLSEVTALYNLQYNTVKLKQYTSKIKQTLVNTVLANSSIKYTVKVEAGPRLKYTEEDSNSLMITIYTGQSESTKLVYSGILLSWGVFEKVPNAVHLPYLLERGEQKVALAVKSALGTIFDCRIKQFSFNLPQLLQIGFSFLECETSPMTKEIGFAYGSPQGEQKDKMTLNFEMGDVYMILNSLKEEAKEKSELFYMTYQSLQNQILHMFECDITMLDLFEITLPKASVKRDGTVRMKSPEMVNCVFSLLNEIVNVDSG